MGHSHTHSNDIGAGIKVAFFLNLAFALFEVVGGLWINSMAILSDALHDFADSLSLGLSWYLASYSERQGDERYSYGYRRFSLLSALINVVVLIAGSLLVLVEAVPRLVHAEHVNAQGMMVFAIIGIVVNGAAALRVRGGKTLNAKAVTWHLVEDVLGWAAVLAVSIVLSFQDIPVLDPLLSILITLYVLYNVIDNLKQTLSLFLQAVPKDIDMEEIKETILAIGPVCSVHHAHVWSLDGDHHVLTMHVVIHEDTTRDQVLQLKDEIKALTVGMGFEHTTIEIEYESERCAMKVAQQ